MSELLNDETIEELRSLLSELTRPVQLVHFSQDPMAPSCQAQLDLLQTIEPLSEKITLSHYDLVHNADKARQFSISKVPATAVIGDQDYGIRFYGLTGGYEFNSLIEDILMVSSGDHGLDPVVMELLSSIDHPTHLEVFVTLTCPYCPKMVRVAHQMAMASPMVRSDMVEASEFPQLVQRYHVGGVPRTVINEGKGIEGALPPTQAVFEILKHVNPRAYRDFEEQMREVRGERHVSEADPGHLYDVLIVGLGPAAMTATIYAARKGRDVLVIGKEIGGQITYTQTIENWPGIAEISGQDLAMEFRNHAERYALAEKLDTLVTDINQKNDLFVVQCDDGSSYRAKSVIYCAGKQYKHLGVPGEQRFIGQGIAFCATCDAPLFAGKQIAVVGGGNSAFTAARDLLGYASEIHIINILPDFQADKLLYEQVSASSKVSLHPGIHVKEFLGDNRLAGIRLHDDVNDEYFDLSVEGVFLEIGLEPNTQPVEALVELNDVHEIVIDRDQSTTVPGLFAAGDCTDEKQKQIVIASGAGARAGLAVDEFLQN
jgi:alkyl hydroperoxide reductase subunit F